MINKTDFNSDEWQWMRSKIINYYPRIEDADNKVLDFLYEHATNWAVFRWHRGADLYTCITDGMKHVLRALSNE